MKPEAQRIAIAETLGANWVWAASGRFGSLGQLRSCILSFSKAGEKATNEDVAFALNSNAMREEALKEIPDYINDLNAMHEAEKLLIRIYEPPSAHKDYDTKLWAKMRDDGLELNGYTWHATAKQRAEAFLKTLNLWEEE